MKSKFRDLIALIEFGDESYVITPFTNDYDNILLSISLIDDLTEFNKFPDQGTTIGMAISQAVKLFTRLRFPECRRQPDGDLQRRGRHQGQRPSSRRHERGRDPRAAPRRRRFPSTSSGCRTTRRIGRAFTDPIWKPVVEKTGGKFYAASDEATILSAIAEIDKVAIGKIAIKQYSTQQPRFTSFGLVAVGFWTLALALQLTVPYLRKFP